MATLTLSHDTTVRPATLRVLFDSLFAALDARRAFEELNALSDEGLARRGLTRGDIPAKVIERL